MKTFSILTGAAGLAALVAAASPAAAQQYPYGYPQQQPQGGVIGAIINSVTGGGYGQYPQGNYGYQQVGERQLVAQCAAAAEQRLNVQYRGNGYGNGYNGYQNGYGANNGYPQQAGGRVLGITNVERRGNGGLRITGVATSGQIYAQPNQGYYGQRQQVQQVADIRFTCQVNRNGQVSNVRLNRNQAAQYRGY
ncbi:hypothetical protein SH584_09965 [Sphingomonas sp. LY29]|uniref:hypothetical protein n=1 Tax=Sphingomonas sp. LY29 TaxID=3095341 RepID=UPI002D774C9E|nr:hypothetical protein [Sphingomonas sp. LY29]WRP25366.1 hypothetical protein SH584_09965 [Sphingomonas sp. LY29]